MSSAQQTTTLQDDLHWCLDQSEPRVVRPIEQWMEEEVILPSGPYRGERYRHRRHPASRLWFRELDSGRWNRFAASGPTQNGKTVMCYVGPILWHLFELQETTIIGLPTMQMAQDKWTEDLMPAIEASRYAGLLPRTGEGSRGGQVKRAIRFGNGVTLRFMTGGGTDKQRAGYTSRVLGVTETDGMDEAGETSREADKIEQLEGRTRAYGGNKRVYLECTVSIEQGRIWQEITQGSDSRIARPCPHCAVYVIPERENLVGWQDAESELEAAEKAAFACPSCGETWTDDQRREAAGSAVLIHRGQKVLPGGEIVGEPPKTNTLGFRWSAIDNPFTTAADLGAEEWRSKRSHDAENAEKKMRQFVWCLPYIPAEVELVELDSDQLSKRTDAWRKGIVPPDTLAVVVGIDTGKYRLHWHAVALRGNGSDAVIEYGEQPTEAKSVGLEQGLRRALLALRRYFADGWADETGKRWSPSQVWIDSGYHEHRGPIYSACHAINEGCTPGQETWRPIKGFGEGQRGMQRYYAPQTLKSGVRYIGTEYDMRHQKQDQLLLVQINSDYWKSQLHQRLAMPTDQPGVLTLYDAPSPDEHLQYAQQITAEVQREEFVAGRGEIIVWRRERRENHYLDAGYISLAAGDFVRRESTKEPEKPWFAKQATPDPAEDEEWETFV